MLHILSMLVDTQSAAQHLAADDDKFGVIPPQLAAELASEASESRGV